jgi:hypothetical protein
MPRRLLLAADIVSDVAGALGRTERAVLETAAAELRAKAREVSLDHGLALDFSPEMDRLRPSIRRLASALAPEFEHLPDLPRHHDAPDTARPHHRAG